MSLDCDERGIDSLIESLQTALKTYRGELRSNGVDTAATRDGRPSDSIHHPPSQKLFESKRIIRATLGILSDAIQSPFEKLMETRATGTLASSLQIVVKLSVPDLLASTPDGLTIDEIAQKVPIDLGRIGSPVRLLTLMGWFKEGPGGRYTNTRLSELLREGGQGGNWIRASEIWNRIWVFQGEAVCKDGWRFSKSPFHTATQLAYGTEKHFFDFIAEDEGRDATFTDTMNTLDESVIEAITEGFPWKEIPEETILVDVGGGVGSLCSAIAKKHHHLNFLLEDRAAPVEQAKLRFSQNVQLDKSLTGRLTTKVHDFFEPQDEHIRGDGYSFILKWILHDWPEDECVTILSHVANAAGPKSRVIIFEHLIQSDEVSSSGSSAKEVLSSIGDDSGYKPIPPVRFLPLTFGKASQLPLGISVSMNTFFNGSDRPLAVYRDMFERAGLELVRVHHLCSWVSGMEGRRKVA